MMPAEGTDESSSTSVAGRRTPSDFVLPRFCALRCGGVDCLAARAPGSVRGSALFREGPVTSADRQAQAPIGVALVDGDERVRGILKQICSSGEGFRHCGFFCTAKAVLGKIRPLEIELVLIELELPDLCGIKCARELLARQPGLKVIIASTLREPGLVQRAFAAGVRDYLVKPFTLAQCLATMRFVSCSLDPVRSAASQEVVPSTGRAQPLAQAHPPRSMTPREGQILGCFSHGLLYKEVEDRLHLGHSVLKKLQHRLFLKLGAHNRTEAVNLWRKAQGKP